MSTADLRAGAEGVDISADKEETPQIAAGTSNNLFVGLSKPVSTDSSQELSGSNLQIASDDSQHISRYIPPVQSPPSTVITTSLFGSSKTQTVSLSTPVEVGPSEPSNSFPHLPDDHVELSESRLTRSTTTSPRFSSPVRSKTCIGTGAVQLAPYEEPGWPFGKDKYQTITAQPECVEFSMEELRLADYEQGRGGVRADWVAQNSISGVAAPFRKALIPANRRFQGHLELLRGSSIEIHVGSCCGPDAVYDCHDSWFLPKALISRYSPFLKAACSRNFKERQENRIDLPEDDPAVFAMFVEWMYYGEYTILAPESRLGGPNGDTNMDARCWVLGDKLLSTNFKNYAMGRLYAQYTAIFASRAVTTYDVQFTCEYSAADSKLRRFYLDFVVENFANPMRLKGTTEEWDEVLMQHSDARRFLLESFRKAPGHKKLVKNEKEYMDQDELLSCALERMKLGDDGS